MCVGVLSSGLPLVCSIFSFLTPHTLATESRDCFHSHQGIVSSTAINPHTPKNPPSSPPLIQTSLQPRLPPPQSTPSSIEPSKMSFSSLVQDLTLRDRDGNGPRRPPPPGPRSSVSTFDDGASRVSHISRAMSYASTSATSVSISGDISSQLHGGYHHPLARSWQAERQLTKVCDDITRPKMVSRAFTDLIT